MKRNVILIGNVIKSIPCKDWEVAAIQMHTAGDDTLGIHYVEK